MVTCITPSDRLASAQDSLLLVVDIQERFVPIIHESDRVLKNTAILMQAANNLGVSIMVSEQYPKGLGPTAAELKRWYTPETVTLEKSAFGCLEDQGMKDYLAASGKRQMVVCGIEAHVCVNQTVHQLLSMGYPVFLVVDAVSSRTVANMQVGLQKMIQSGAIPCSTEMVLFEWMRDAAHPDFKAVQALIKTN